MLSLLLINDIFIDANTYIWWCTNKNRLHDVRVGSDSNRQFISVEVPLCACVGKIEIGWEGGKVGRIALMCMYPLEIYTNDYKCTVTQKWDTLISCSCVGVFFFSRREPQDDHWPRSLEAPGRVVWVPSVNLIRLHTTHTSHGIPFTCSSRISLPSLSLLIKEWKRCIHSWTFSFFCPSFSF